MRRMKKINKGLRWRILEGFGLDELVSDSYFKLVIFKIDIWRVGENILGKKKGMCEIFKWERVWVGEEGGIERKAVFLVSILSWGRAVELCFLGYVKGGFKIYFRE